MYSANQYVVVVESLSHVQFFSMPWTAAHQASLSITISLFSQTHVHWVSDAIQPSHPLSPPSPLVLNFSQLQILFQWVSSSHQVAEVLELELQHQFLPINIQDWFPIIFTGLISLLSKGLSRVFSSTTVQKCQFFSAQHSLWSNSHIHTWLLEKPQLWLYGPLLAKWCLCFLKHCLGLT